MHSVYIPYSTILAQPPLYAPGMRWPPPRDRGRSCYIWGMRKFLKWIWEGLIDLGTMALYGIILLIGISIILPLWQCSEEGHITEGSLSFSTWMICLLISIIVVFGLLNVAGNLKSQLDKQDEKLEQLRKDLEPIISIYRRDDEKEETDDNE